MLLKSFTKRCLGQANVGRIDFVLHKFNRYGGGVPFNGQRFRCRIFFDLMYAFDIAYIVETGTHRGATTILLAATGLPVYSSENNLRYFSFAKLRFAFSQLEVSLRYGDSRSFLSHLIDEKLTTDKPVFFYLDAHWGKELPLQSELELIFANWSLPIVMIDDFCVPDSLYNYDDYGSGNTLDFKYISPIVKLHELAVFYPAIDSEYETGSKRGSVVLCRDSCREKIENQLNTLIGVSE